VDKRSGDRRCNFLIDLLDRGTPSPHPRIRHLSAMLGPDVGAGLGSASAP
jgi:hypothetical protein